MRIEQLLYITEIAKTGSISNAAERLYVSSPGISLAIRSLEEELEIKIFERSRTGLEPTETGKKLINSAQEILNRIEQFKQEAKSNCAEIEGHLSISAVSGICKSIIPRVAAEFHTKYPKVTFQIKEAQNSQVRKDVLSGDADIGIIFSLIPTLEENQLLTNTHLLDSSMMICFHKDSELAKKELITSNDLHNYPVALNLNINETKDYHSKIFGNSHKPNILISQNFETKKQFILQGLAIGFEPEFILKNDPFFQREDIIVKTLPELNITVSYYCIKLKNRFFSTAGKEFLKALHKYSVETMN